MNPYLCGAEIADRSGFELLRGRKIGVLGNPTSLIRRADPARRVHLVDALRGHGIDVVRLFGPEHGLWATAQDMIGVASGTDPVFGLPVHTLYGHDEATLLPRPDALRGIDTLVFDVQDVGARYYTYAATLCMAIDVCATAGVDVVVLDRCNPLGGEVVEGNRVDAAFRSFVGWLDIPQRHGLTVGEIARLHADESGSSAKLTVIACEGWRPADYIDEQPSGFALDAWTCPSPNMPTVQTAVLYPGGCLIEGTLLSEGRGTTRPFELIGAPGMPAREFADAINSLGCEGLSARPYIFEPRFQKHAGLVCGGACLEVTDRRQLQSVRAGIAVIEAARLAAPDVLQWRTEIYEFVADRLAIDLLMGGPFAREALLAGAGVDAACADFGAAQTAFAVRASPHLLYARENGPFADGT